MLAVLRSPALRSLPILPALLQPPSAVAAGDGKHALHCVQFLCNVCEAQHIPMEAQAHAGACVHVISFLHALVHAALHAYLPNYHALAVKKLLKVCSHV